MRGKLMFIGGSRGGLRPGQPCRPGEVRRDPANAKKVWEHPTVQEAAGVAQAQANKLYTEGKDKLSQTKLGEKLHAGSTGTSSSDPHRSTTQHRRHGRPSNGTRHHVLTVRRAAEGLGPP